MILWKAPFEVSIKSYSSGHIDCCVFYENSTWRFTGFYGNPVASLRDSSWELLRRLHEIHELQDLPWLIGGDFNEIFFDCEKLGGIHRSPLAMDVFRITVEDCGLQDLHC